MSKKIYNDRSRVHFKTCKVCGKNFRTNMSHSSTCYTCYPDKHKARVEKLKILHEIDFREEVFNGSKISAF